MLALGPPSHLVQPSSSRFNSINPIQHQVRCEVPPQNDSAMLLAACNLLVNASAVRAGRSAEEGGKLTTFNFPGQGRRCIEAKAGKNMNDASIRETSCHNARLRIRREGGSVCDVRRMSLRTRGFLFSKIEIFVRDRARLSPLWRWMKGETLALF